MNKSIIEIYTDGSATTKDKPGGYGYVLVLDGEKFQEGNGNILLSTNNDAELKAATEGLQAAFDYVMARGIPFEAYNITLISDSEIVLGWASGTYGFSQKDKIEHYEKLKRLMNILQAKTRWVKGHSGQIHNERCDELANQARLQLVNINKKEEAKITGETLIGTKKQGIVCLHYDGKLVVIDLENLVAEVYNREIHGPRGSLLEIRKDKNR